MTRKELEKKSKKELINLYLKLYKTLTFTTNTNVGNGDVTIIADGTKGMARG